MKVASLIMAIIGVVFGVIFGLLAMAVGGIAEELDAEGGNTVVWLGLSAVVACIFGMVCSAFHFAGRRQGWMAVGILVAAAWHLISLSAFGAPGFILLLLAGIFALFGRDRAAPAAKRFCPSCGRESESGDGRFCPNCGGALSQPT